MILDDRTASVATDAMTRLLDGGTLRLFSGPAPGPNAPPSPDNVVLVVLGFSRPAFAPALVGIAQAHALSAGTVVAAGTASWCRATRIDGDVVFDGTVGTTDDADVVFPRVAFEVGEDVVLESFTYRSATG